MAIRNFTDLEIYQLANSLSVKVYKITSNFPSGEKFGIVNQLRRATASVGANIAESFGRYHYKDKVNFLYHARGSLLEVQHFLILSKELKFIEQKALGSLLKEITNLGVKLNNYITAITKSHSN